MVEDLQLLLNRKVFARLSIIESVENYMNEQSLRRMLGIHNTRYYITKYGEVLPLSKKYTLLHMLLVPSLFLGHFSETNEPNLMKF